MLRKSNFFIFSLLSLLSLPLYAQDQELTPYRVIMHVHSHVSGDLSPMTFEEIAMRAKERGIEAVIMTDYWQQKVSLGWYPMHRWLKYSYEKESVRHFGTQKYFELFSEVQEKVPEVLMIPGVEITPFYWWSGSLFKNNLTVHDLQKNLLVTGLDPTALDNIPTIESGNSQYDAYHGGGRDEAHQGAIDYVRERGGVIIWSTPDEAFGADFKKGPVRLSTPSYTESLEKTENYTGIAIYPEGFLNTGKVGGVWDKLLKQYCRGQKSQPVWAYAESVIHQKSFLKYLDRWDQIVYAKEKTNAAILEGLKQGRVYVRGLKQGEIILETFEIYDSLAPEKVARVGEELGITGQPIIKIKGHLLDKLDGNEVLLDLVRSGEVVQTIKSENGKFELVWEEEKAIDFGEKVYYRLNAVCRPKAVASIVTNPIFIERIQLEGAV